MSFPHLNSPVNRDSQVRQAQQMQQVQQAQQPQQAEQAQAARSGEATGIQTVVQNARSMEAQPARSAEASRQQTEARGVRGLGGRILSFIFSIGRSIGRFFGIGRVQEAPPPRVRPDVEAKTEFNKGVLQSFLMKEALPEDVQRGIDQGLNFLKIHYKEGFRFEGTQIQDNAGLSRELYKLIAEAERDLDRDDVSSLVQKAYHINLNRTVQVQMLSQALAEIGHASPKSMDALMQEMKATMDAQGKGLALVGNVTDTQFKEMHAADFKLFAEFVKTREIAQNGSLETQMMEQAAKLVADKLGISADLAKAKVALLSLKNAIHSSIQNIQFGTSMDQLKADLNTKIEAFADKVVASFNTVDKVQIPIGSDFYLKGQAISEKSQISNDIRTHFKNQALSNPTLPSTVFQDSANLAGYVLRNTLGKSEYDVTMDKPLAVLPTMLKSGSEVEFKTLYSTLVTLCDHLECGLDVTCKGTGFDSGNVTYTNRANNELTAIRENALRIVMDKVPEIRDGLKANPALLDKIAEQALNDVSKAPNDNNVIKNIYLNLHRLTELVRTQPSSNADLARSISSPATLPPAHMVSFEQVKLEVSKAFPELALDDKAFKAFDGAIAKVVLDAQQPLNAADFGTVVRQAIIGKIAAPGIEKLLLSAGLTPNSATSMCAALLANNPDLKTISSSDDLKIKLNSLLTANQALLSSYQTIDNELAKCKERVVTALTKDFALSKDLVSARMDMIAFRINAKAEELRASLKDPTANYLSADYLREQIESMAVRTVEITQELLDNVNNLALSQDQKTKLMYVLLGNSLRITPGVIDVVAQVSTTLATNQTVRAGRSALELLNRHDPTMPPTQIAKAIIDKVGNWFNNRILLDSRAGSGLISSLPTETKNFLRQVAFEVVFNKEPGYRELTADARAQLQNVRTVLETERGKSGYAPDTCDDSIAFIDQLLAGPEAFLA